MGTRVVDLTGRRFGRLTVLGRIPGPSPIKWNCRCECGQLVTPRGSSLQYGSSLSCGYACPLSVRISPKRIDMVGRRFGRILVVSRVDGSAPARWMCQCDCGRTKEMNGGNLRYSKSTSCGCGEDESRRKPKKHGHTSAAVNGQSPTYMTWQSMILRCYRPSARNKLWQREGILMCDRWRHSFENFLADMGPRPSGTTIDRIDNAKGYELSNCRWATPTEQSRNRRPRNSSRKRAEHGNQQAINGQG